MSLRLAIRVDASTRIGSGHVRRCLALASAARREGASIVFVCRDLGLPVARQLRQSGEDCLELPRPQGDPVAPTGVAHADWAQVDQMRDAAETVAALAGSTFDWVVVDHYSFDARWHRAIREATGARVLVVPAAFTLALPAAAPMSSMDAAAAFAISATSSSRATRPPATGTSLFRLCRAERDTHCCESSRTVPNSR